MHRNEPVRGGSSGVVGADERGGSAPGVDGHDAFDGDEVGGFAGGECRVMFNACGRVQRPLRRALGAWTLCVGAGLVVAEVGRWAYR